MYEAQNPIIFSLFLIFTGAALFATLALYARQALPIAYIMLGILIGPYAVSYTHLDVYKRQAL